MCSGNGNKTPSFREGCPPDSWGVLILIGLAIMAMVIRCY